jgi:nucleoside phosphorylase
MIKDRITTLLHLAGAHPEVFIASGEGGGRKLTLNVCAIYVDFKMYIIKILSYP